MIAALVAQGASVAAICREAGVTRSAVRHFKATGGKSTPPGRQPFFSRAEEELLVRFIKLQAVVGCGLTRVDFLRWVGEYVAVLSSERQSTARAYFGGKLTPGVAFYRLFMCRWPGLREYRVGTIEQGRAGNARPDVVSLWYAGLRVLFRDLKINHAHQLWNMDETHVKAREVLQEARSTIIGPSGLQKPEVIMAAIGFGAAACTAAFTVSPAGIVAPHFVVVSGSASGHAYVKVADDKGERKVVLASRLNDSAMVVRRDPPGFDKQIFDLWADHIVGILSNIYPKDNKLVLVDGAKVHLSVPGILTLMKAGVTVVAQPSKLSHLIQALDNKATFGSFQPAIRRHVQSRSGSCVSSGGHFSVLDLMDCVKLAADDAFSPAHLAAAFAAVGVWPLDPTKFPVDEFSKGADKPLKAVDLKVLTDRVAPVARKALNTPTIVQGTLSTAGKPTALTAPDVLAALQRQEKEKRDKEEEREKNRKVTAAQAAVKKAKKTGRDAAAEKSRLAKAWGVVCAAAVEEARYRLAKENPSPRKRLLRARAARQRSRVPERVPAGTGASSQSC